MDNSIQRHKIDLNPTAVRDETVAALEDEIREQAEDDLGTILSVSVVVLDSDTEALDSHAIVFTEDE